MTLIIRDDVRMLADRPRCGDRLHRNRDRLLTRLVPHEMLDRCGGILPAIVGLGDRLLMAFGIEFDVGALKQLRVSRALLGAPDFNDATKGELRCLTRHCTSLAQRTILVVAGVAPFRRRLCGDEAFVADLHRHLALAHRA